MAGNLLGGGAQRARRRPVWLALTVSATLAACGGGGGGSTSSSSSDPSTPAGSGTSTAQAAAVAKPASADDARRFLSQATFGPTDADVAHVMDVGYAPWIDEQFAKQVPSHLASWQADDAALKAADPKAKAGQREVLDAFYRQAVSGDAQLRLRVAFALSEIFVISMQDGTVGDSADGVAGWLDMLSAGTSGTYRELLEQVARHPMMGAYLSHLKNQKEDAAKGRVPDENFAREVMQLFSIGLYQLGPDGTPTATPTYTHDDIAGLAKVFTGWSWDGPDTADGRFWGWCPDYCAADRKWQPMQGYTQFHSLSEKSFLGTTVAAQSKADPQASMKAALDTLAAHPNVGPFIGRQLIQRLVTSHPSAAYVGRVAKAFADNGSGVRGDLKAVVKAVLLDREARDATVAADPAWGKLREPVLRLTAALRAFGATSDSGHWLVGATDDPGTQLGQTPMRSPSVFNFFRPGYVAPGTKSGAAGLTTPEMQITHETSVAGYANFMRSGVQSGFGQNGIDWKAARRDVQLDFAGELALADQSAALVDRVAGKLMSSGAVAGLKADLVEAVESVSIPTLKADASNQKQVDDARRNRVSIAVLLALVSPEFLVQK